MFVSEITDFLYKEIEEQHRNGHFDDVQYAQLNSMIDDIGRVTNIAGISISVKDFGEMFEKFGGDVPTFEKHFADLTKKNRRIRIAQRIGHAVIRGGKDIKETADLIKRRLNKPLNEKEID